MVSRDYTEELGMAPRTKRVPMPVALAIIGVIAAGVWYGVSRVADGNTGHQSKGEPAAVQKPAPGN